MQTLAMIVYVDGFQHLFLRIPACREAFSRDGLDLQAVVPVLDSGVVNTVTLLNSAHNEAMSLQETASVVRAVWAATGGSGE